MTLTLFDWFSLLFATITIAAILVVEHYLTGNHGWPTRWKYAEGLLTVLGGLLLWAAVRQITIDWLVALAMLVAGCLAGLPDWVILKREQAAKDAQWATLEAVNEDLAAKLHLLLCRKATGRYMQRLQELVETAAFASATMQEERKLVALAEQQAKEILADLERLIGEQCKKSEARR